MIDITEQLIPNRQVTNPRRMSDVRFNNLLRANVRTQRNRRRRLRQRLRRQTSLPLSSAPVVTTRTLRNRRRRARRISNGNVSIVSSSPKIITQPSTYSVTGKLGVISQTRSSTTITYVVGTGPYLNNYDMAYGSFFLLPLDPYFYPGALSTACAEYEWVQIDSVTMLTQPLLGTNVGGTLAYAFMNAGESFDDSNSPQNFFNEVAAIGSAGSVTVWQPTNIVTPSQYLRKAVRVLNSLDQLCPYFVIACSDTNLTIGQYVAIWMTFKITFGPVKSSLGDYTGQLETFDFLINDSGITRADTNYGSYAYGYILHEGVAGNMDDGNTIVLPPTASLNVPDPQCIGIMNTGVMNINRYAANTNTTWIVSRLQG